MKPLFVPKDLRTRRALPRAVAVILVLCWGIVFTIGTRNLARKEKTSSTVFDELLELGVKEWGVTSKNDPYRCIGYFQTTFTKLEQLTFRLEGAVNTSFSTRPHVVDLNVEVTFGEYNKLERLLANVTIEESSFVVESDMKQPQNLIIHVTTAGSPQADLMITRPDPIFLVEQLPGQYSLRFPPGMRGISPPSELGLPDALLSTVKSYMFSKLDFESRISCQEQVNRKRSKPGLLAGLIMPSTPSIKA